MKNSDKQGVPSGSRGVKGTSEGTSKIRTPKSMSSASIKFSGLMDSRAANSDRNQSAA